MTRAATPYEAPEAEVLISENNVQKVRVSILWLMYFVFIAIAFTAMTVMSMIYGSINISIIAVCSSGTVGFGLYGFARQIPILRPFVWQIVGFALGTFLSIGLYRHISARQYNWKNMVPFDFAELFLNILIFILFVPSVYALLKYGYWGTTFWNAEEPSTQTITE